jgi:two-component system, OmpR family, response regulator
MEKSLWQAPLAKGVVSGYLSHTGNLFKPFCILIVYAEKGNHMKSGERGTIMLVEDDPNLSTLLRDFLEIIGYRVMLFHDGQQAIEAFGPEVDLCVLDVMMPLKDGFTLANEIKAINPDIPLIFLTAKTMQEDRIKGFKTGCDDYITKPFSTEELHLRIAAILRRSKRQEEPAGELSNCVRLGEYTFDPTNLTLSIGDDTVTLTRKEADLLQLLCQHRNQLLTREFALKKIWGSDDYFIGRSMDVFITKLRKHLKQDPAISITNVHGVGFRLEVPTP